ncbi:hypothetical protein [Candidatus Mycoplasma haematohominis]|uniref:Uncharacterized protein n=1 Tax=Candidatus Mycoplasma haematohominis TaxID=1494318 RepID=A0A478FPY9_9MOLU|nr:hypothetical protein [Candidatus Mycoplasma haemohominis]GCE63483.1 hypothetical protein MHSWG343_04800 [Candidatus Mycoplasma haemohominis]
MTPQAAAGIGAGAVLAGGTGIGAYMIATSSSNPVTLEEYLKREDLKENNKTQYTGTTKLGSEEENRKLLVADVKENESWWNDRFKKYKPENSGKLDVAESDEFKGVTKGYGAEATTALNKVCDAAYQKDKASFKDTGNTVNSDSTQSKSKRDVEKFCTLKGTGSLKVT